jgi:hypothetical protein
MGKIQVDYQKILKHHSFTWCGLISYRNLKNLSTDYLITLRVTAFEKPWVNLVLSFGHLPYFPSPL